MNTPEGQDRRRFVAFYQGLDKDRYSQGAGICFNLSVTVRARPLENIRVYRFESAQYNKLVPAHYLESKRQICCLSGFC